MASQTRTVQENLIATSGDQGQESPGAYVPASLPPSTPFKSNAGDGTSTYNIKYRPEADARGATRVGARAGTRTGVDAGLELASPATFSSRPRCAGSSLSASASGTSYSFPFYYEWQMSALSLNVPQSPLHNQDVYRSGLITQTSMSIALALAFISPLSCSI